MHTSAIQKAGGVITRKTEQGEVEVYMIHRPRYDDWSLPKGHIDEGESPQQAAEREVLEETGFMCNTKQALPLHTYNLPTGEPVEVHFFHMIVRAKSNPLDSEADMGEWLPLAIAIERMSYESEKQYVLHIATQITS